MSQPDPAARTALLETAFDSGIRHFDVAPYYGYGEAEAALGAFLRSRRDEVTVTTKFGIQPPGQTSLIKHAVGWARRAARASPLLRRGMQASAGKLVKRGDFSVEAARKSLDSSLQKLQTGHVDFYLLHDCRAEDARSEDLMAFLKNAVTQGKILRFGVGTDIDQVVEICRSGPGFADVIQFENSVLRQNRALLPDTTGRMVITHRSLNESLERLARFFASDEQAALRWSRTLGVDCADRDVLGQLTLDYAVRANPGGLVLFSSRSAARIKQNIRSITASPYSDEQIAVFAGVAGEPGLNEVL